jgi:hypothetical protein
MPNILVWIFELPVRRRHTARWTMTIDMTLTSKHPKQPAVATDPKPYKCKLLDPVTASERFWNNRNLMAQNEKQLRNNTGQFISV